MNIKTDDITIMSQTESVFHLANENHGITLIALIITVIVLLILSRS